MPLSMVRRVGVLALIAIFVLSFSRFLLFFPLLWLVSLSSFYFSSFFPFFFPPPPQPPPPIVRSPGYREIARVLLNAGHPVNVVRRRWRAAAIRVSAERVLGG